jgi:ABC-type transport system substrate-binding protein
VRRTAAAAFVLLAALVLAGPSQPRSVKEGGTFRIGIPGDAVDSIDAALGALVGGAVIHSATCASLMRTLDAPLPQAARIVPDIAAADPKISANGKTYMFVIRKGLRFSTGAPVTARDVAHTINRVLDKRMKSPLAPALNDIAGARALIDGKAASASGVAARGSTLTIRLTKPSGDFAARMSYPCVVPRTLPVDPEGAKAPIPSAGPYFVAEYLAGTRAVLERNNFYRGDRPHHIDRFEIDLSSDGATVIDRTDRGELDYGWAPNNDYGARAAELARKYGINKSRFFTSPSGGLLRMFVLNTSRPLFRGNVALRQALNFAVDRRALLRERGFLAGRTTDQYLWPGLIGYRDERIYPLERPDVKRARILARGHTRSGKAVLYVPSSPLGAAQAQILTSNFRKLGIRVETKAFPGLVLFDKLGTRGEPFDIGWIGWGASGDPGPFLVGLFHGREIGQPESDNWSYFDSQKYNRLLDRASRLTGSARYRAYGDLDVDLARNAAPAIAYAYDNTMNLVSERVGCVVVNPYLDLAAACLK